MTQTHGYVHKTWAERAREMYRSTHRHVYEHKVTKKYANASADAYMETQTRRYALNIGERAVRGSHRYGKRTGV